MGVFRFISMQPASVAALTWTHICIFTWTLLRPENWTWQRHFAGI